MGAALADTARADTALADAAAEQRPILAGLAPPARTAVYDLAAQRMRIVKSNLDAAQNSLDWERQRADRYRVEIYKKFSMAVACVVFVLIGIPLGLSVRRGGLGVVGGLAVGIFLFYWVTLVQGEKLADRDLLAPWVGMWAANVLIGGLGVYLLAREARDSASRDPLKRLLRRAEAWKRGASRRVLKPTAALFFCSSPPPLFLISALPCSTSSPRRSATSKT